MFNDLEKFDPPYIKWKDIKEHFPNFAQKLLAEYERCNGFVPYEPGFVYVLRAEGTSFYKIGKSIHPDKRHLQISPKMPFPCNFVTMWRCNFMSLAEKLMHEDFARFRANGEWFEIPEKELYGLLRFPSESGFIKYAYVEWISKLLEACPGDEASRFRSWYGENRFDCSISRPENELAAIESLFTQISREFDVPLPADVEAALRRGIKEFTKGCGGV